MRAISGVSSNASMYAGCSMTRFSVFFIGTSVVTPVSCDFFVDARMFDEQPTNVARRQNAACDAK